MLIWSRLAFPSIYSPHKDGKAWMSSEKTLMVITAMVYADSGEEETLDSGEFSSKKGVIINLMTNHDLPSPV